MKSITCTEATGPAVGDWGGASSLRPSGFLTQTQFHKHSQDSLLTIINCKTFIFSSSVLLLCVHTRYNPFAHPSCSYYYFPIYWYCTSYLFCTFYSIAHFTLYFSFLTYIYALVLCYFYIIFIFILLHCPLSGPDLIYISILIIPCIIYYVTNNETLNFEPMLLGL